jgi:RecA/RadA recombinase
MNELLKKLKKSNTIEGADTIKNSKFFVEEFYTTGVPALDIALSARVKGGGFSRGSLVIAGNSKTFKTLFMLILAKEYMDSCPESIFIFFDAEYGCSSDTMESVGIDTSRVYHKPIMSIEDLKLDIAKTLKDLTEEDKIFIGIDSLGQIASKKEMTDAEDGNVKVDMTRAKEIGSFWRIINPHLNVKKIPLVAIAKTYETQELYSKTVIAGGKGMELTPNNIWVIGKQQEKDGKEFVGSNFIVNVHKSRLTKEKSKFPIKVTFEGGLDKYSSLLDIARATGHVTVPTQGWYSKDGGETKLRNKDTNTAEFWGSIIDDVTFQKAVKDRYSLGSLKGEPVEIEVEQDV